jgi:hypothetical protein
MLIAGLPGRSTAMDDDRIYFARRAAEEEELAASTSDPTAAMAHVRMQRAYLERASVGDRPPIAAEPDRT